MLTPPVHNFKICWVAVEELKMNYQKTDIGRIQGFPNLGTYFKLCNSNPASGIQARKFAKLSEVLAFSAPFLYTAQFSSRCLCLGLSCLCF